MFNIVLWCSTHILYGVVPIAANMDATLYMVSYYVVEER